MIFSGLPDAELAMWATELARTYLAGVLQTGSVNGVTMTFANRNDLEARMGVLDRVISARAGTGGSATIQSLTFRTRRFY